MSTSVANKEAARQALQEIQRYLADEIAPLMTVDAAKALLHMPPKYGAAAIEHWLQGQLSAPDRAVTVSSYLYHAVKKIHVFSEFKLVDPPAMERYVSELSRLVIRICPEREQAELRLRLSRVGESETRLSAPVGLLNRELGNEEQEEQVRRVLEQQQQKQEDPGVQQEGPKQLISPQVAMLMEQLEGEQVKGPQQGGAEGGADSEVMVSLVSRAAIDASDPGQFESSLDQVRQMGIEPKLDHVFQQLSKRLPGWEVDLNQAQSSGDASLGHLLKAMKRIVSLAGTTEEGADRFSSMVYAAIEQFNDGHLAQAVAMFDVAQRLIDDNEVDAHLAGIVRTRAERSVSLGALRKFSSVTAKHGLLRRVLDFFQAFSPTKLLERLDGEPKREVRKLMLSLLEVHGPPCRSRLLERLDMYLTGRLPDPDGFYSRNVIFLLRRVSRASDDEQDQELVLLTEYSRPERPFMVTKEAVGALALLSLPGAERVLIDRLTAFEHGAVDGSLPYAPEETLEILNRACAALARLGTRDAVLTVIAHGLRKESRLGNALGRLQYLSACKLAQVPDQLQRLLDALRKTLPTRVLGLVLGRKVSEASHLVRALSGTPESEVQALFEEIVERFPDHEFAEPAREALTRFRSKGAPESEAPQALSGDLSLFELPTLLQSMADSELTGRLVLTDPNGRDRAVLLLHKRKIRHCEVGRLRGLDAACHLFERPQPGTFRFEKTSVEDTASLGNQPLDVVSTILEAMRRHDEFQQDRALVPDGSALMPSGTKPSLPESEKDTTFARAVWREARRGTSPESCEGNVGDAYRVRRLYAHWLEVGALALRPAA